MFSLTANKVLLKLNERETVTSGSVNVCTAANAILRVNS